MSRLLFHLMGCFQPMKRLTIKWNLVVDDPVEQPPSKRAIKNQKYHENNSALTKKLANTEAALKMQEEEVTRQKEEVERQKEENAHHKAKNECL